MIRDCDTTTFKALGGSDFFGGRCTASRILGTIGPHLCFDPPTGARRVRHSRRHYDRHRYCGTCNRRWARQIYTFEADRGGAPGLGGSPCTPNFSGSPIVGGNSGPRSSCSHVFRHSSSCGQFPVGSLIPLICSFANLGIKQIQRDYDYRPEALAITTSSVTALAVAALAAATIMADHRVIVLAFLIEAAVYVAASHIFARSPMWVIPDLGTLRRSLAYGVPLMLNGAGLALIGQADRVVVGRLFGMDILGVYAVIFSLPWGRFHRSCK